MFGRGIGAILVILLVSAAAFVLSARSGWLTPGDAALRQKYALPNSQFIDIDGQSIHVVDEGSGDAILLLHGSFGSLRMWDDWARALAPRYHVVRFDIPPMGLSGPDPAGHYDLNRDLAIVRGLTERLGLKRFFLVATSSGGLPGAAYAAENPGQIEGLILSNIAVGPFKIDRDKLSPAFKRVLMIDPIFAGWHPREFWRQILLANFADAGRVNAALVDEWDDLNNRAQRMPQARDSPSMLTTLERTPHDLPLITAPTLVLWSANDHEVPAATVGARALQLLGSPDKSLVLVPDCGHILPVECGAASVALALPFFDRVAALDARRR